MEKTGLKEVLCFTAGWGLFALAVLAAQPTELGSKGPQLVGRAQAAGMAAAGGGLEPRWSLVLAAAE